MNHVTDRCTGCQMPRPKSARWYWVDSNAKPPVVFCPPCAETKAPKAVATRAALQREVRARTAETRRRRRRNA